ncbi:lysoplasmalogenase [Tropicimonas sp. TH_r6]|uniref:lysoplasmalogenase n=1 Tax=Tropicimonas sp. TH_r6 TaxID=3082085 RepID=UPI00295405F4|nr:lysoplasmalogenase [Tropicimonas sp. TH_r6]MDV7142495.1 lysoplasmalogenase [Tropicimonas sp. TH_r6]
MKTRVKTASTALLALAALAAGAPVWLTLALGLGALGDLMLSRDGERAFLAGLIAFAAAHLAYLGLFVTNGQAAAANLSGQTLPILLLLGFGATMARLLWPATGALRGPVMGYVAIILAMGLGALALPPGASALPLIAAFCFIASDAILAAELFLLPEGHPARRATPFAIWLLYWSAQALFLVAFLP